METKKNLWRKTLKKRINEVHVHFPSVNLEENGMVAYWNNPKPTASSDSALGILPYGHSSCDSVFSICIPALTKHF